MKRNLQLNPDGAKLPLFDHKEWRMLLFAVFADSVNKFVELSEGRRQSSSQQQRFRAFPAT